MLTLNLDSESVSYCNYNELQKRMRWNSQTSQFVGPNHSSMFQCEPDDDADFVVMKYGKLSFVDLAGELYIVNLLPLNLSKAKQRWGRG